MQLNCMQNVTEYYILSRNVASVLNFRNRVPRNGSKFSDWLIIYCFTSRSRIFHLYGDITITGERLQNLGLCSALRAFEQRGIFIVPHLLWHGPRFFRSHPKDHPIQSPLTTHEGMCRIYSNADPHGSPISRLLRHTRGCGGPILTRGVEG
jgi:hypothetical protein